MDRSVFVPVPAQGRGAGQLKARARALFESITEAAFPVGCTACSGALDPPPVRGPLPLCGACAGALVDCGEPFCLTCVRKGGAPRRCSDRSHLPLAAAFVFTEPVRALVHAFKFGDAPELAGALVTLGLATPAFARIARPDLVVPAALHPVRRRERGYDQAALLARAFGERVGSPDVALLVRVVRTRQQARLTADARARNVAGAFAVTRADVVRGRRIAIVDDVVTTGATLEACAAALRRAGAARIEAWAVAYEPLE